MALATTGAVLGVIRASRPSLKTPSEKVAFAVHAAFLAVGYSVVAVGESADACAPEGVEEAEVGIEGWNDLEGAYAFRYVGADQQDLCKGVTVKMVAMANSLMVDAAPTNTETLLHLEIRANEFAKEGETRNYEQQFTNLEGLVSRINASLLSKLAPLSARTPTISHASSSSSVGQSERQSDARRASAPPLLYETRPPFVTPGFVFPPISGGGNGDLFPGPGGGIFAPRRDIGPDGLFVGPNDGRWGRLGGGGSQPGFPDDLDQPGVPPGARFDPFGPPGVPGFDPNLAVRPPRRPPGGHPDLEHFTPEF